MSEKVKTIPRQYVYENFIILCIKKYCLFIIYININYIFIYYHIYKSRVVYNEISVHSFNFFIYEKNVYVVTMHFFKTMSCNIFLL